MTLPEPGSRVPDQLIRRTICGLAGEYIDELRVVIINGPRQSGKTTLLRELHSERGGTFLDLDLRGDLRAARTDPVGIAGLPDKPIFIDEVHRAGDPLVLAVKSHVDRDASHGQFVLAGSMRFLTAPGITESLAGRAGLLDLWPLSQGELGGVRERFVEMAFEASGDLRGLPPSTERREGYFARICGGGYPEPLAITSPRIRGAWYEDYLSTVIQRDLRETAKIREPGAADAMLRYFAATTAQVLNTSAVASKTGIHRATVDRYLGLLESVFLLRRLAPWSRNLLARVVKHPKVHLCDTGLAAHLLGVSPRALAQPVAPARGALVESFIVGELLKQATWSEPDIRVHHWRDRTGLEVDAVLETRDGRVVGIESKAADSVDEADFRGLIAMRDNLGDAFVHGFVLYTGPKALPFGDRLTALPLSALWHDYS